MIERFDHSVDQSLERLRTARWHRIPDHLFRTASVLGDFSLVWHLTAALRGLTSDHHANQAMILWLLVGLESLVVNQGIKRLFRRQRPMVSGDPRYTVRTPSTSSFPSGHASSAFFVATVLIGWDGWAWAPRQWTKVTADTGIGDPAAATAKKGEAYFNAVCAQVAQYFAELAALDTADPYLP